MTIDIIIPAFKPGREFHEVLSRLSGQTVLPEHIEVVNTEEEYWNPAWEEEFPLLRVRHIRKEEFDHGGTRKDAARRSGADILVFMTQDAVPCRRDLIEKLILPISESGDIAASYARQRPRRESSEIEKYTRSFNYPRKEDVKYLSDAPEYGIKTFFCSNVCAAYRRSSYLAAGEFPDRAIFNEDMIMAGRLMGLGYGVAYAADAEVFHSHDYSTLQQFRRNFDIGVSQAEHPEVFGAFRSEGEGIRLVKSTMQHLAAHGDLRLIPRLMLTSAGKYAGFRLGKQFRKLPRHVILACTMNREYWEDRH